MRTLVLISTDHYVRNFIGTGAFAALDPEQTVYLASEGGVIHTETREQLEALPGYLGTVDDPREEARSDYRFLRFMLLAVLRRRSRTMADKVRLLPWRRRLRYKLAALPGVRSLTLRRRLRRTGLNRDLHARMEELAPDLVVAPSGGYDTLVWDGLRSARALGVPTLMLVHNWDNLSSKGAFAARPDYLGVWGEQSVDHAVRIHGFPRDRVRAIGVPTFDHYFRHEPGSTESPFPFRYVLFAGCFAPFDERSALERLERAITESELDVKVVYRPHPHRRPRAVPDFVDEERFEHVVLDPQMRDIYRQQAAADGAREARAKPLLPSLDYYPALFEHAELVICPLSTMIVEAAIFDRRVLVIAYDDGIHPNSPAVVVDYDHFEGIDRIDGFTLCRRAEELPRDLVALLRDPSSPARSLREQIRWWLHHDERTYAERLGELVREIADRDGLPAGGSAAAPPEPAVSAARTRGR